MDGPGEYLPDVTEGITRIEDVLKAKVAQRSRNYRRRPCPECGHSAYRDRVVTRTGNGYQTLSQKCIENEATWLRRIPSLNVLSNLLCDPFDRLVTIVMRS